MKILELLISFRPGGAERVAVELARGLRDKGTVPDIYSLIDRGFLREFAEEGGIRTGSFGIKDPRLFPLVTGKLNSLAGAYDLCISHCTYADYALSLARTGGPKILTIHSVDFNRWRVPGWANMDKWFYGRADSLVAVSQLAADTFSEKTGISKEKIRVIRNGVDPSRFFLRREASDPPAILVVGRFFPVKRHDLAIKVSRSLHDNGISHKIIFAGDGPLKKNSERFARETLPEGSFEFLGAAKNMPEVYAKADILLITSSYEGIPVSMLEAMASGLPVVSTAVGGIPEVITNGVEGFLIPYGDTETLVDRACAIIRDQATRRVMGQNARSRVERDFSLDRMTNDYLKLFKELT